MIWIIPALIVLAGGLLVALIMFKGFFQVSQSQAALIERFGKFNRVVYGGLHVRIPFLETFRHVASINRSEYRRELGPYRIDMREQIFDVNKQHVITKDNIHLDVDTIIYYRVVAPEKAAYGITDLPEAVEQLALTFIRDEFGRMSLDDALGARSEINGRIHSVLGDGTGKWGIEIVRVEVQEIVPPSDLKDTMQKQMIAERDRRAKVLAAQAEKESMVLLAEGAKQQAVLEAEARKSQEILKAEAEKQRMILEAEAEREQQILRAQGKKEALVLESDGDRTARINEAEGTAAGILKELNSQAEGLAQISRALNEQGSNDALLRIKTLEAAVQVAEKLAGGQATKIFMPQEVSGLMGSLLSLGELLKGDKR